MYWAPAIVWRPTRRHASVGWNVCSLTGAPTLVWCARCGCASREVREPLSSAAACPCASTCTTIARATGTEVIAPSVRCGLSNAAARACASRLVDSTGDGCLSRLIVRDLCGRLSSAAALVCASVRSEIVDGVSAMAPVVARMAGIRRKRALMDGSPLQFNKCRQPKCWLNSSIAGIRWAPPCVREVLRVDLAKQSATEECKRTIHAPRMQRFTTGNLASENT